MMCYNLVNNGVYIWKNVNEQELAVVEEDVNKSHLLNGLDFIVAVIVVLALLGGIGYGLYTGVSYVYRAVTGTTETTDTAVDNWK